MYCRAQFFMGGKMDWKIQQVIFICETFSYASKTNTHAMPHSSEAAFSLVANAFL